MRGLLGIGELLERGVTNLAQLREVQSINERNPMACNATLRLDEWRMIDQRINDVMRERLTIVDDLRGRGLVTGVGLGTILRVTERLQEFGDAEVSFDADTAPEGDRPSFQRDTIPVPVVHKDFTISWRQLEASRTRGEPLDLTSAAQAARKVRDRMQDLFVNGFGHGPTGGTIPGLLTAANRQTVSIGVDWDTSGADVIADVGRMLDAAYAVNLFGPFFLYVPKNYWRVLQDDYNTQKGDRTFIQRILAYEDIESVRPLDTLPDDNVTMVQMTEDALDLTEAQAVTTVQWEKNPFVTNFRVLTVGGPQIKTMETDAGAAIHGIIHMS